MARTKKSKKRQSEEVAGQADPRAPLDSAALLAAARPVLARLEADLIERAASSPAVRRALEARYNAEKGAQRTAESFAGWTAALATQVAAAWLLSCVFVRTLEDRGLLKQARIAGPGAEDSQRQFDQLAPSLTARDYLLMVFRELSHHPAARDLFDAEHSLVWKLSPSADAAKELLALFRTPSATTPAFRFGQPSTRFLGDLYQDLSEDVRKRYALLQTPDFIESFILDRTLEPAIQRFGLDDTTLIDPTCGSGHFLLGAFDRLFEHRLRAEPGIDARVAAVKALDAVYGADINPYAVAIARFRLTLSFLDKAGYTKLADAPALPLHLVVADSLRINAQHPQTELWHQDGVDADAWLGDVFSLEDERAARDVLFRQYAAVVGNPPYITVKDAALREVYRGMYTSAAGKYALSAPFCERFFQLARPRGYTGQITANSFMKREFGKRLVEDVLPKLNLELIVNISGAYIPGHGTPTVLLFGTNEPPQGTDVLATLAKRGEPSTPDEPAKGHVWSSIASHFGEVGFENDYISVARVERELLAKHPWSLGGGGASELKELLEERANKRLEDVADSIGIASFTLEDDVYLRPREAWLRIGVPARRLRPMAIGEVLRDWSIDETPFAFFPYDDDLQVIDPSAPELRYLWPFRTTLANNKLFGGKTKVQGGLKWYEFGRLTTDKLRTPLTIAFAEVATHNHFVLDRGGKVFKQTAPIIKLPASATEDDHLALLAYLNSSTACFWLKQACMNKGGSGIGRGIQDEAWESRFQFDGTKLASLPTFVGQELVELARQADAFAQERQRLGARRVIEELSVGDSAALSDLIAREYEREREITAQLVSLQEDIDWAVYSLAGLVPAVDLGAERSLRPGHRSFEHRLMLEQPNTQWFERNSYDDPRTCSEVPRVVAARCRLANEVPHLALIEQPEYKRRWVLRDPEAETSAAAKAWIATQLERALSKPRIITRRDLVQQLLGTPKGRAVASLLGDQSESVRRALADSAVPFLAAARFTESGLAKHAVWQETWRAQRIEDAGGGACAAVPPKYDKSDFLDDVAWTLRGKLDVPKERFVSYPYCESDVDGEPVYGWAGWDHLQRAHALGALYLKRRDEEGWTAERLTPMLAGLLELIPWLKQWHNEPSAEFDGQRMGDYYENFLNEECRRHHLTHDDLRAWRPPKKTRGSAKGGAKARAGGRSGRDVEGAPAGDDATPAPAKKPRKRNKKGSVAEVAAAPEAD